MIILTPRNDYKFNCRDARDDPSDDHDLDYKVVKETWVENVYHIEAKDFYDSGVFIDIGANIGAVSLYVDSLNHERDDELPIIRTFAIEPEPTNLKYLRQNIEENPTTDNIEVIESVVWHEPGVLHISNRGGNSSIYKHPVSGGYTAVSAMTIRQVLEENGIEEVDVMKVDIEGAEYDLLINTPDDVLAKIKYITLEFDSNEDGRFGILVDKLSRHFGVQILGSPARGGYIYARRY